MAKLTRLTAEDRENLAAYLDGELGDQETRRIESLLTQSEVARNDVDILGRTYEMLDLLPRPTVSKDFTEKTLASIQVPAQAIPYYQQPWFQHVRQGGVLSAWGLAMLVSATLGYALTSQMLFRKDALLLRNLPLIQKLDVYSEVGDTQFLKELSHQSSLLKEMEGSTPR